MASAGEGGRRRIVGRAYALRGNRELINVYVAAVNVYNCRGRRQVCFIPGDGHVPSEEAPPGRGDLGFITVALFPAVKRSPFWPAVKYLEKSCVRRRVSSRATGWR